MRRSHARSAACVVLFLATVPAVAQAPAPTPDDLNTVYTKAKQAKDWPTAIATAQQMVNAGPSADHLLLLADAQMYSGAETDAMASYDRALAASQAEKPADNQPQETWQATQAKILIGKGDALLKSRRNSEAMDTFRQATRVDPHSSVAWFNLCATLYNTGDTDNAVAACRQNIQVDPAKADAWFILGSLLYISARTDATGKFLITPECRQALDKYLELAPSGPHAADVKAMLDAAK